MKPTTSEIVVSNLHLFSNHPVGFDINEGRLDKLQSPHYFINSHFTNAYEWLYKKLGTEQILWTYPILRKPQKMSWNHACTQQKWILEVPLTEILCIIDEGKWHSVLNNSPCYNYDELKNALQIQNPLLNDSQLDKKIDEVITNIPKEKSWDTIFQTPEEINEYSNIIIPFPVHPEWVKDTYVYSTYSISDLESIVECIKEQGVYRCTIDNEQGIQFRKSLEKDLPYYGIKAKVELTQETNQSSKLYVIME